MLSQKFLRTFIVPLALFALSTFARPLQQERSLLPPVDHNDYNCKPSLEHPNPLILVHGLLIGSTAWAYMAPLFEKKGYCVFTIDYSYFGDLPPFAGTNDIYESAHELSSFIDKVLAITGASKVDIFGHSEGSIVPRVYMKYFNGVGKTGSFAAIGPVHYGTTTMNIQSILNSAGLKGVTETGLGLLCKACSQMLVGSPFLRELNEGGDTYPEIKYLMIATSHDELVTPYSNGFLRSVEYGNVINVLLQDLCPLDISEHFGLLVDPVAFDLVESFLSTGNIGEVACRTLDPEHLNSLTKMITRI
ncbi:hypothetical protein BGZ76_010303 [Entomortierella beljakovae]|nr:hypothetical protein BGZ76_010303 [Entomortierella beljakovae]